MCIWFLENTSCFLQWPFFQINLSYWQGQKIIFLWYISFFRKGCQIHSHEYPKNSFIRQHVYQISQLHLTEDVSSIMSAVESVFFIKYIYEVYQDLILTLKCIVEFRFQRNVQFESYLGTKLVKLTTEVWNTRKYLLIQKHF